ncbi:hypothetical protein [Nostoc sp.]
MIHLSLPTLKQSILSNCRKRSPMLILRAIALVALMNLSVYAQSKLWCYILSQHPLIQYDQW